MLLYCLENLSKETGKTFSMEQWWFLLYSFDVDDTNMILFFSSYLHRKYLFYLSFLLEQKSRYSREENIKRIFWIFFILFMMISETENKKAWNSVVVLIFQEIWEIFFYPQMFLRFMLRCSFRMIQKVFPQNYENHVKFLESFPATEFFLEKF